MVLKKNSVSENMKKNIPAWPKNPPPPLEVKWSLPYQIITVDSKM